MIEIKKVRTRGKRTRLNKSYPRTKINILGGDRVATRMVLRAPYLRWVK